MAKAKINRVFTFKRCPYCFTSLSLDADVCIGCHKRVCEVDRYGLAKRPVNYLGYLAAVMWVVIFIVYIWFAFIR